MNRSISTVLAGILLAGLYLASRYNYLLFHSLAELFSIVISAGIFTIAWHSRRFHKNGYLLLLGIAYLSVGALDLIHTLAYKGMGVFPAHDTNLPTQFWIAARYVESLSLLLAPFFLRRQIRPYFTVACYTSITGLLLLSIFAFRIFPDCYVEGLGLTNFKVVSEYLICAVLVAAIVLLVRNPRAFDPAVMRCLIISILLAVVSELTFTLYVDVYGFLNFLGHYLKILSCYFVYKAIIETGLTRPYALLFHELTESEERYHSLFTHMINGVARHRIVLNEIGVPVDYVFLEVNDAFEQLTGLKRADLIGKRVTQVIPGIERDPVDWIGRYGRVALKGEPVRFESYAMSLDKWYSLMAYCPQQGYFVVVFEDITERKRAEAALQAAQEKLIQSNEDLERTVRQRTAKLRETIADLEHFSYSIAHDMRAPLRSMNSFSTLLLQDCAPQLDTEHANYLERIASAAQRLDLLIRDVLNYSKVARGEFAMVAVDLDALVSDIVRGYPCFQSDQAEIEIRRPLGPVLGNTALLTQCISNLLTNAIKFVPPGTKPHVQLWTEPVRSGWVRLNVQDNGIGIADHHKERIWRIFERLHHQHEYTGTGIGLSLVRRAAERMNGVVGVQSELDRGSRFWIELPTPDHHTEVEAAGLHPQTSADTPR